MEQIDPAAENVANAQQLESEAAALGISVARLLANRRNAQKSTGPKTEAGKARSALNSFRNGVTGQIVCKTAEELEAHQKCVSDMLAELGPSGPTETSLAISIVENTLRLHRIRAIEDGIYAEGFRALVEGIHTGHPETDAAIATSKTWLEHAKSIALLSIYESRIRRGLAQDRAELRALQAERKAAYDEARQRALELVQLAESNGEVYHPGDDFDPPGKHGGFVFSRDRVRDYADRQRRFQQAKFHHAALQNPQTALDSDPRRPKTGRAA